MEGGRNLIQHARKLREIYVALMCSLSDGSSKKRLECKIIFYGLVFMILFLIAYASSLGQGMTDQPGGGINELILPMSFYFYS